MHNMGFKANGAVVYWSLAEWNRYAVLNDGFERLGLATRIEARTNYSALKDALADVFRGDFKVEPLDDKGSTDAPLDAFEVVSVTRGKDQNVFRHILKASIGKDFKLTISPWDQVTAQRIANQFGHHSGLVRSHKVTEALVGIIATVMQGQCLRPRGGLYWIPSQHLELWQQIGDVVQRAAGGTNGGSKLYTLQVLFDPESVRAVRDALAASIRQEVARIKKDVMESGLGANGLESRRLQAVSLREQVRVYEGLLEVGLQDLSSMAEEAELAAADAALSLAAGAV